jgi:molecular chaperone HtpG
MGGHEMDRVRRMLGKDVEPAKRALEINRRHPIIRNLAERITADTDDPLAATIIDQLYDGAMLVEGLLTDPASMLPRIQQLMEAAVKK